MKNVDLFLDSGAFSAFTQGTTIDIEEYISFIKQFEKHFTVYANLDVLNDPKATLQNQKIMERAGLHPLPCFHCGEPIKYLLHYLDNYDYIALGGMATSLSGNGPPSAAMRSSWFDKIFSEYICAPDGMPRVKVHGFGMTSLTLMTRYPWYSVDSTSWVVASRMGQILVPHTMSKGAYLYDDRPHKVQVSSRSPGLKVKGEHIETLNPALRSYVMQYFKVKGYSLGKSTFRMVPSAYEPKEGERWFGKEKNGERMVELVVERGLSNDYTLRDELDILYYLDLEKSMPPWPWPFRQEVGGFGL